MSIAGPGKPGPGNFAPGEKWLPDRREAVATVLRAGQRCQCGRDARVHVRPGCRRHPRRERRRIQLIVGTERQRSIKGSDHLRLGLAAVHQVQEPGRDPESALRRQRSLPVVHPMHRRDQGRELSNQSGGRRERRGIAAAEPQAAHRGPEHRHRVGTRRDPPDEGGDLTGQSLGGAELAGELPQRGPVRQPALEQQKRGLLVGSPPGELRDIVAAVGQPVVARGKQADGGVGRDGAIQLTRNVGRSTRGRSSHTGHRREGRKVIPPGTGGEGR